ncbi:hypothetical protein QVD99_004088 [Batrachochytrium dendrobatidis]|nr:hypothetical protein O5D80_005566 [Batrachochytrium dendrobatidis]KAK5669701.1 hypothetical protein QVD99_004088 [Batrachochytrium dendrobatidis]
MDSPDISHMDERSDSKTRSHKKTHLSPLINEPDQDQSNHAIHTAEEGESPHRNTKKHNGHGSHDRELDDSDQGLDGREETSTPSKRKRNHQDQSTHECSRSSPEPNGVVETGSMSPNKQEHKCSTLKLIPKEQLSQEQIDRIVNARTFADQYTAQLFGISVVRPVTSHPTSIPTFGVDPKILSGVSRIYIGSIPFDMLEENVRVAFLPFGCIKSISMTLDPATNRHKGFCFLEYDVPDSAHYAIERMNGLDMGGRALRVGRPSNFSNFDVSTLPQPMPLNTRLFISNVSEIVSEDDITALFETFGKILSCSLIPNVLTRRHKTYGYIQYESSDSLAIAITTMNNFELGGKQLVVGKGIFGTDMPVGMKSLPGLGGSGAASPATNAFGMSDTATGANGTGLISAEMLAQLRYTMSTSGGAGTNIRGLHGDDLALLEEPQSITASQRYMIMQKLQRPDEDGAAAPSTVLLLCNMITFGEIDEFLQDEIKQECEKYGLVNRVVLWQDKNRTYTSDDLVMVYVEFGSVDVAIKARLALDGRFFGGRKIQATYTQIPQDA